MSGGKKILVIDDEPDVTDLIEYKLKGEGFSVRVSNNPAQILGEIKDFFPDLIILDIMMPELDGLQVCRMIRSNASLQSIPIIFLTAKGEQEDRIEGLEAGADDYLGKPFNTRELILRIQSIFKRITEAEDKKNSTLSVGGITVDTDRHRITVDGNDVTLTATEFRLIHLLMSRIGKVLSREELLSHVWNYSADVETRTVDTHIRRLREKLETKGDIIKTVRGVGYKIVEQQS
ncbi:MAG: response regulator transcription factor [Opitutales bacterium]|nr:response regulator transcription factor [Opitutales bacterium]